MAEITSIHKTRTVTLVDKAGRVVFSFGINPVAGPKPGVFIMEGHTFMLLRGWTYQLCDHMKLERTPNPPVGGIALPN